MLSVDVFHRVKEEAVLLAEADELHKAWVL
jgi:hypothetical protein